MEVQIEGEYKKKSTSKVADYRLVRDLFEVIPELLLKLLEKK